jgi:hypothetical protein
MSHVTEKLAEFIFEELSVREMAEARSHLADCSGCREQVERFQHTLTLMNASPEIEPPRSILFEFEKNSRPSWITRWLAPMAASAAVALAVVTFVPRLQPPPQVVERVIQQPSAQPVVQQIDYQKILDELRASDQAWLSNELKKRDAAHAREIQRVRGEVASLDFYQRKIERDTWENARDVQLLAAKTDSRE